MIDRIDQLLVGPQGPSLQTYTGTQTGFLSMINGISTASVSYINNLGERAPGPLVISERTDYKYSLKPLMMPTSLLRISNIFKQSLFLCTLYFWNQLDLDTRTSPSLSVSKEGITPRHDKFEHFYHSFDQWVGIHYTRIRIGCSNLVTLM